MPYALGVDIGGTKISVTLGNSSGKILAKEVLPTRTGKKTTQAMKDLVRVLKRFKSISGKSRKVIGIGVGVPGPMDPERGIVQRSPHLKGWQGLRLKSILQNKLRLPVFITNDANAAAVGEQVFGAGRHTKNFAYLTVSTGIGSGIILDGNLLIGASYGAGEVGHTIISPGGVKCGCGQRGCLEAYASGTAIAQFVRQEIRRGRKTKIKNTSAEAVAAAAEKGDALALEAYRRAGYYLGIGLANLINILNPEMLILGGSVMRSSHLFWPSMTSSLRHHAWPSLARACKIVKTRLGDRVGDLGALALVFACR